MLHLETERLNFRLWEETDHALIEAYFMNTTYTEFIGGTKNRELVYRKLATYIGHFHLRGYSYLAVEEKSSKKLIGGVGLWNSIPWPEMELGYWLLESAHGKGYATEAASRVKKFAFEELKVDTLVSYIDSRNEGSIKVAERMGGVFDKEIELIDFGKHDVYRYSK